MMENEKRNKTVGERIKTARRNAKLTQAGLAAKIGAATGTVQQYELGKREPRLSQLEKIATALDVSVGELLGTEPQIDREYEDLTEVLRSAGFVIEPTGFSDGPDEGGDLFYVWDEDAENPEEERVELVYRDLLRIVQEAEASADRKRTEYLRSRLLLDLF